MKNKILHLCTEIKSVQKAGDDTEDIIIEGMASTNSIDRVGDVIEAKAWNQGLKNFKNNPIILFNHDSNRPIGRASSVKVVENGLHITAKISASVASDIVKLVAERILGTFSVGFQIKDATWDEENHGLVIKSAELLEVSVVSVPANQDATFSIAKSFDTEDEYREYLRDFNSVQNTGLTLAESVTPDGQKADSEEIQMDPKDLEKLIADASMKAAEKAAEAFATKMAVKAAEEKTAKDAAEAAKAASEAAKSATSDYVRIEVTTAAEKLLEGVETRFAQKDADIAAIIAELKGELTAKSDEIKKIRENKAYFQDRSSGSRDWKEKHGQEITNAALLGLVTRKGFDTVYGRQVIKAVNDDSGIEVSSADFEQIVSTNIERDVELAAILPALFREIAMKSATMIIPILPDADYAQFSTGTNGDTADAGSAPKGNLDARGAASPGVNTGIDLTEKTIAVKRIISKSYVGNETEEDAILPIVPLLRESMVRAHVRALEQAILNGGLSSSPSRGTDVLVPGWNGLLKAADTGSKEFDAGAVSGNLTTLDLMATRALMGKYGIRPADVVYIVSLASYYDLLQDPEFADVNLVGADNAVKLKGQIGSVYGSPVIVCDEFTAQATNVYVAAAVNTRGFVMPRLRGFTMEQDYSVENQRRTIVASQRVGFEQLHTGTASYGQVATAYFSS